MLEQEILDDLAEKNVEFHFVPMQAFRHAQDERNLVVSHPICGYKAVFTEDELSDGEASVIDWCQNHLNICPVKVT